MNHLPDYLASEMTRRSSGEYLGDIEKSIDVLTRHILECANNSDKNHGFIAEYWHADTFNIVATAMRTANRVKAEDSPESRLILGGADITTSWGENYGSKYCQTGYDTAMAQAKPIEQLYRKHLAKHPDCTREEFLRIKGLDPNTDFTASIYCNQARLCPADQLESVKQALQKKIDSLLNNEDNPGRAANATAYIEALKQVTDHIEGPDGEKSLLLSYDTAKAIRDCAKTGNFNPEDYDISAAILADKTFLFTNAIKAGGSSAIVGGIMKMIPGMISVIKQAVEDGRISAEDLEQVGKKGASAAATSFARGLFTSCISTASELGYFGPAVQKLSNSPYFSPGVASVVSLSISVLSDTIDYGRGDVTKEEYGYKVDKSIFVASAGYGAGVAVQSMLPELPYIGYMLGSCVGTVLGGLAFEVKEKFYMGLCVQNGWSLWGFVKQDYELPMEIAVKLGYNMMEKSVIEENPFEVYQMRRYSFRKEMFNYEKLDITPMVRGQVGIRKIGYVRG